MYQAINNRVIIKRDYTPQTTQSGIIVEPTSEGQILEYEVVGTTETTAKLQGKIVIAERHRVRQFKEGVIPYGSLAVEDILAIKD